MNKTIILILFCAFLAAPLSLAMLCVGGETGSCTMVDNECCIYRNCGTQDGCTFCGGQWSTSSCGGDGGGGGAGCAAVALSCAEHLCCPGLTCGAGDICCLDQGGATNDVNQCCQQPTTAKAQYLTDGHCCPVGSEWDGIICRPHEPCYNSPCTDAPGSFAWWHNSACWLNSNTQACCPAGLMYGDPNWYDWEAVTVY